MKNRNNIPLFCLVLLSFVIQPVWSSFTLTITTGESECFSIRVPPNAKSIVSGSYEVLDEDETGTKVQVMLKEENTPQVNVAWSSMEGRPDDSFRVVTDPDKRYSLCFLASPIHRGEWHRNRRANQQNRRPPLTPGEEPAVDDDPARDDDYGGYVSDVTHVGFSLRYAILPRSLDDGEAGPEALRALQMVEEASYIHQDWQNLLDHFDFLRHREGVHIGMMNAIFTRLFRWTLIEAGLVVLMAVIQVMYWRKFFEQRRYL